MVALPGIHRLNQFNCTVFIRSSSRELSGLYLGQGPTLSRMGVIRYIAPTLPPPPVPFFSSVLHVPFLLPLCSVSCGVLSTWRSRQSLRSPPSMVRPIIPDKLQVLKRIRLSRCGDCSTSICYHCDDPKALVPAETKARMVGRPAHRIRLALDGPARHLRLDLHRRRTEPEAQSRRLLHVYLHLHPRRMSVSLSFLPGFLLVSFPCYFFSDVRARARSKLVSVSVDACALLDYRDCYIIFPPFLAKPRAMHSERWRLVQPRSRASYPHARLITFKNMFIWFYTTRPQARSTFCRYFLFGVGDPLPSPVRAAARRCPSSLSVSCFLLSDRPDHHFKTLT